MATLPAQDRLDAAGEFMSDLSREREVIGGCDKNDVRAAFNALDDWFNTNAGTLNTAIPQPARGALTAHQKARLLMMVIRKRYLKGV